MSRDSTAVGGRQQAAAGTTATALPSVRLGWPLWSLAALLVAAAYALVGLDAAAIMLVAALFGLGVVSAVKQVVIYKRHDYRWYRRVNPGFVDAQGRVRCHACGHNQVRVTNLMNRTYTRAHVCGQCGTTLYYSPER